MHRKLVLAFLAFVAGFALSEGLRRCEPTASALFCPEPPPPRVAGDLDGDRMTNITDAVYLLNHLFLGGPPPILPASGPVTTVIITRHAERLPGGDEAELRPEGFVRAEQLAQLLRSVTDPCAVLASTRIRTHQTLAPWYEGLIDPPPLEQLEDAGDVVERVRSLPLGSTSVLCHHSFTIPTILRGLGLPDAADIGWSGDSHDHLVVALLPQDGEPQWIHMSYADLPPVPKPEPVGR